MAMNLGYQTGSPIGGFTKGLQAGVGLRQQQQQGQRQDRQLGMQEQRLEMDAAQAERMKVQDEQAAKDMEKKRAYNAILQDPDATAEDKIRALYNSSIEEGDAKAKDEVMKMAIAFRQQPGNADKFHDFLPMINLRLAEEAKENELVVTKKDGSIVIIDKALGTSREILPATKELGQGGINKTTGTFNDIVEMGYIPGTEPFEDRYFDRISKMTPMQARREQINIEKDINDQDKMWPPEVIQRMREYSGILDGVIQGRKQSAPSAQQTQPQAQPQSKAPKQYTGKTFREYDVKTGVPLYETQSGEIWTPGPAEQMGQQPQDLPNPIPTSSLKTIDDIISKVSAAKTANEIAEIERDMTDMGLEQKNPVMAKSIIAMLKDKLKAIAEGGFNYMTTGYTNPQQVASDRNQQAYKGPGGQRY